MAKFIITQADRYSVEANSLQEAQERWRNEMLVSSPVGEDDYIEYLDGYTTYEEED